MNLLFGFGNKARQGKDTAAEAILSFFQAKGVPAISMPFAKALREEVANAIRMAGSINSLLSRPLPDGTVIPNWVKPEPNAVVDAGSPFGKHPLLLQWWGTEYRRAQNPDYWVTKAFWNLRNFDGVAVISDLRFVNEFNAIKRYGGHTVNITRLNTDGSPFVAPDRDPQHISEVMLDGADWDFFIKIKSGYVDLLKNQAISLAQYVAYHPEPGMVN